MASTTGSPPPHRNAVLVGRMRAAFRSPVGEDPDRVNRRDIESVRAQYRHAGLPCAAAASCRQAGRGGADERVELEAAIDATAKRAKGSKNEPG